ncbi:MAG: thioredoxin domain-containing protein, partial [Pirellulales bacterium]|nr:thioredoxin domain-containing protein [Pirellulales bacterium]
WCGPCRMMSSVVDELASDVGDEAHVLKVNVDEAPELASQYQVQSIPAFIVLRDGEVVNSLVGVQSKQALAEALAG